MQQARQFAQRVGAGADAGVGVVALRGAQVQLDEGGARGLQALEHAEPGQQLPALVAAGQRAPHQGDGGVGHDPRSSRARR